MKSPRGLQAKFLSIMGVAFAVVAVLILLLLQRQERIQSAVVEVSREAMRDSFVASLRRHGEGEVAQLAGSLTNPLYYFDLDAIGELSRAAMTNPGVRYVVVYDVEGNIVHDGSEEIPSYGKRMGVGTAKRFNSIKWTVVEKMIWAWILTIPAAGGIAYGLFEAMRFFGWI